MKTNQISLECIAKINDDDVVSRDLGGEARVTSGRKTWKT